MASKSPVKKLSTLADLQARAAKLRADIAAKQAEIAPLKEEFAEVEQAILNAMVAAGTEQFRTAAGSYSISRQTVPHVTDWAEVDKYILKTKSLDLLHRRLTATAWAQRLESGIVVPGVEASTVVKLAWRGAK
jgi:hypothetical protein